MFADPPYNVAIDGNVCGLGRIRHREFAMGCSEMSEVESMTFLKTVFDRLAEHTIELQRVMDNPRFLLTGECEPLSAGRRVRIYASRGPYVCIYPQDTITPCKWTHKKVLSK